jgi:hypothetical protein
MHTGRVGTLNFSQKCFEKGAFLLEQNVSLIAFLLTNSLRGPGGRGPRSNPPTTLCASTIKRPAVIPNTFGQQFHQDALLQFQAKSV